MNSAHDEQSGEVVLVSYFRSYTVFIIVFSLALSHANAWPHRSGSKAQVVFSAEGTMIRGTWGLNEDTYLVFLAFPKEDHSVLAKLVDSYPNEWPAMSFDVLTSSKGTKLRVKRDPRCDVALGKMILRAAPGDLEAILLTKMTYQPRLSEEPPPTASLPCYHVLRR
jgi:hypothetical protein